MNRTNRAMRVIAALAMAVLPTRLAAQATKDSVVAVVNEFFRAMTARDTAAMRRVQLADGISYAVRYRADSVIVSRGEFETFVRQLATMRDTLVERMWQPTVLVHGAIATVWAPYDIHRNRQFVHCGVDAFTLIRGASGWRIATVSYTAEPTGCAPSPLGPLK